MPAGFVSIAKVNGPSLEAPNSFEAPDTVAVRERRVDHRGPRPRHRFPAHWISVLRFEVDEA